MRSILTDAVSEAERRTAKRKTAVLPAWAKRARSLLDPTEPVEPF